MTPAERLTLRVLSALLREDVLGLRTGAVEELRADGRWLRSGRFALPVAAEGFQCEDAVRLPLLEADGEELGELPEILMRLAADADPLDRAGHLAFAEECRQTLATMELHESVRDAVHGRLAEAHGKDPARWTGLGSSLAFDTLAAYLDHPVYPTARGRSGLSDEQLRSYAPEFHPSFELRWLAVPVGELDVHGVSPLPAWWPSARQLGVDGPFLTIPVHPLTVDHLPDLPGAVLIDEPYLEVLPTLSMRTVAVAHEPSIHLKLPLATATLGMRNRRTIKPGTLTDGAAGQLLLQAVLEREPRFAGRVLHADEQCHAQAAGDELLAVLLRRYPAGLGDAVTVPLAALLAPAPGGRLVVDHLADRFWAGSVRELYRELLELLLDWQTTLFGYGIALESHQQNTSLVLDTHRGRTRLRLLYKDNDGPRINLTRLGGLAPYRDLFDDERIFGDGDRALTDLFTTITGHLCTAALAFGLAEHGRLPLEDGLGLLRDTLTAAVDRLGEDGAALRRDLLEAERLPVKAMVTAGTLLAKDRSGATDINKHYTDGPNYLLRAGRS
ncbi:IucA/IucC family protein [Kitasatospora terrestris]|uniref:Siderophore biosynthesis protein PsvB n=1 Tax=Kitasatospora terrestris TaxID=258051 RepID=A0ABP9E858_9ACTN